MEIFDLSGNWILKNCDDNTTVPGHFPGGNYIDLQNAEVIDDPFWGQNEDQAAEIAKHDYSYSRTFNLPKSMIDHDYIELVASGVDTLARIYINGIELARVKNCHRTYRLDIKSCIKEKNNQIEIYFDNPFTYIAARHAENPIRSISEVKGINHLRKVQSQFGWDWAPELPQVGITDKICVEAYDVRINDVRTRQSHQANTVRLSIEAQFTGGLSDSHVASLTLTDPQGNLYKMLTQAVKDDSANFEINIDSPQLWWCNGLGDQPLYDISLQLTHGESRTPLHEVHKRIGLRKLELDTSPDEYGGQFRFIINGVPIFAKGANWIPTDTFINRTTQADLKFYIENAKWANMNMLRVWGGGFYESDAFYDLCDRNGILVWQDFAFACSAYPFYQPEFLENVHQEAIDNITRLRHHACLALWCGNNENELLAVLWKRDKETYNANNDFYFDILRSWVEELDGVTPYWPGSPSSGSRDIKAIDLDYGDNHLWGVWHGLLSVESFRQMPARFCSEFGVESFPSMRAIRAFTDKPDIHYLDKVMLTHQKSAGGNQKILFYLLANYRNPKHFDDFIYLSQLSQSRAVRFATDEWRRNPGRCNGSLFWQYNDCWPVASWSGIDYLKQPKALHYHSREFNKMVCLSNDYFRDRSEIHVVNDLPSALDADLIWKLQDFTGKQIASGKQEIHMAPIEARKVLTLTYASILNGKKKNEVVLVVSLKQGAKLIDSKSWLLVPDKFANLPKPSTKKSCTIKEKIAEITLNADTFARSVFIEFDGMPSLPSDNFFDINSGEQVVVTLPISEGMRQEELLSRIRIKTLADVEPKSSLAGDAIKRFLMRFNKINFTTWLLFKFVTQTKKKRK